MTQNSEHNMPQDGLPELLRGDREPTDAERDAGSEELMERVGLWTIAGQTSRSVSRSETDTRRTRHAPGRRRCHLLDEKTHQ